MITIRDPDETFQSSLELAPWDASEAVGGSELIKNACQKEIEQSQCGGKLPLYNCLMEYNIRNNKTIEWLSPECKRVVSRCTVEGSNYEISGLRRCSEIIAAFQQSALNGTEVRRLESLLQRMDVSLPTKIFNIGWRREAPSAAFITTAEFPGMMMLTCMCWMKMLNLHWEN